MNTEGIQHWGTVVNIGKIEEAEERRREEGEELNLNGKVGNKMVGEQTKDNAKCKC